MIRNDWRGTRSDPGQHNIQGRSGRVAFPRVKVMPAIPAAAGRVAEAPARRAARVELRKRVAAMVNEEIRKINRTIHKSELLGLYRAERVN